MTPWTLEILTIRNGSHSGAERRSLSRDVERGLLVRLRSGAYVERRAYEAMTPEGRHIVRMRAFAAVSDRPPMFSHWSAAVVRGYPVHRSRLEVVHTTVDERRGRGQEGVSAHLFRVQPEQIQAVGDLLVTSAARTVIDIAGASPFEEGVMTADHALRCGMPRETLEETLRAVGPRHAAARTAEVIAFAHPGAESAAESYSRVGLFRSGIEPPALQYRMVLGDGSVIFLDFEFPSVHVGGEADGDSKYLTAPEGAGTAIVKEKRREDEARLQLNGLARWGWVQSLRPSLLRAVLAKVGVLPQRRRPTLAEYAAVARAARPRSAPRRVVQR